MKVWPTVERITRLTAAYWNGEDDGALDEVREYYHPEFSSTFRDRRMAISIWIGCEVCALSFAKAP